MAKIFKGLNSGLITPFGSFEIPEIMLRETAATVKLLNQMEKPLKNKAAFDKQLKSLHRMLLYSVARNAVGIARSVVMGGSLGASIEGKLARAHPLTMDLRLQNKNKSHPLKEYEKLAKSIAAEISRSDMSITVGVKPGAMTANRASRPGQGVMPVSMLAYNLEYGFAINVTEKARQYFKFMAIKSEGESEARASAGNRNAGGKKTGMAAAHSREASAWWAMYGRGVGVFSVPARPFMQPSIQLAGEQFMASDAGQYGQDFIDLWTTGKAGGKGLYGGVVSSGVA